MIGESEDGGCVIRLSRLGRCVPLLGDRPRDIAKAGVLGGPGLYGVLSLDPPMSIPGAVGVGQTVVGLSSEMTLEVVGRERERVRPFGFDRFILNNGRRFGGDDVDEGDARKL